MLLEGRVKVSVSSCHRARIGRSAYQMTDDWTLAMAAAPEEGVRGFVGGNPVKWLRRCSIAFWKSAGKGCPRR